MKLTKKKALEIAIELWEWMVDNRGKEKEDWPGWEKYGKMAADCPFCEYNGLNPVRRACNCPLGDRYGHCTDPPCAYGTWEPDDKDGGHKVAVEFLAQLKELR